jgi:hypothetical protein
MKRSKAKETALFIAELHNRKIDAIRAGLSPIEYLKTTRVFVTDNYGQACNANEWYIAEQLEKILIDALHKQETK